MSDNKDCLAYITRLIREKCQYMAGWDSKRMGWNRCQGRAKPLTLLLFAVPRFCGECLQPCLQVTSPLCPLCRVPFDPKKVERSSSVEKQLASYKAPCRGCSKKVDLYHSFLTLYNQRCHSLWWVYKRKKFTMPWRVYIRMCVCVILGNSGEDEGPHRVLFESTRTDCQLPQVCLCGTHLPTYTKVRSDNSNTELTESQQCYLHVKWYVWVIYTIVPTTVKCPNNLEQQAKISFGIQHLNPWWGLAWEVLSEPPWSCQLL